ncbi:MAG: hypothetical protein EOO44_20720 [Flavobacterium sp.]|nr:MAG: hypothetical protein EOO44_20720 [Flavobacterium sp.]
MDTTQKEAILKLMTNGNYFTKLKTKNDNSLETTIKVSSYSELNQMIFSLLKTCINTLQNDASNLSESGTNVLILLEMALQLLPECEMELLDELRGIGVE